ncbi:MAG: hypothetical protein HN377_11820 [Alphaproteobacteria bacterium]|nr:hypothetical protein [Alphaproteobacteria bacterium]
MPKTPEHRAALQKRLKEHALQITDSTLRSHFLALFNDRLWAGAKNRGQGKQSGASGAQGSNWTPSKPLNAAPDQATAVGSDAARRAQQVLLAIIINHPEIFDRVEETLGHFSFTDARLDQLRQELISVLLKNPDLDCDGVKEMLGQSGFASHLEGLFRDSMIRSNRIIRADAPVEKYQLLWDENVALLENLGTAPEVEKIRHSGDGGIAEADWERQRALIEQAMPGHRD